MPIPLTCPQCAKRHRAPDSLAGRQAKCGCGAVLKVPAAANAFSATQPAMEAAPERAAAGVWQAPATAAAGSWGSSGGAGIAASESSVFDELSTSDVSRFQARLEPAPETLAVTPAFNSHISPGVNDCLQRAKSELAERRQVQDETLPQPVIYAICGLAVPGGISLVMAIVLMVLLSQGIADLVFAFSGVLAVMHTILAVVDIGAAVMIHQKVPGARAVGYVVAVMNICSFGPLHVICAIMGMVGLSTWETIDYLAQPRKPLWQ
ncbi:MAG: hypothetical protein WD872_10510 [Pirellulaceae bacterium]